jgi:hypothetical protein
VQSHDVPLPAAIIFGYTLFRAMVAVEGATVRSLSRECATMIVIGIIFSVFGIGFLYWLMFTLAVYALPFFAGITVSLAVYHSGAGVVDAPVVGFAAGAATLVVGRFAFAVLKLPALRGAIAFLFAAPAAIAGYHATLALAQIGVPSTAWREAFAIAGAVFVGGTALVRMSAMATPLAARHIGAAAPAQPRIMTATNQR